MKAKAFVVSVVVSAAAAGTLGAGTSLAATLYTSSTHKTVVPVGTTAVGASGVVTLYSGTAVVNSCKSSKLDLKVTQNSDGTVAADITGGSFSSCDKNEATTVTGTPWSPGLVVTGSGTVSGKNTVFGASVSGVSVAFFGGTYTGNLTSGIDAQQATKAGAPLTLALSKAGTLTGPLTQDGLVTATYKLTGKAAKYSLGS